MSLKLLFFDTETTGVRYWKDGIHQISGYIDIDGEIKETFDFKVQPNPNAEISDEALAIANITREQIANYPPMKNIYLELVKMLGKYVDKYDKTDKFYLVGFNNASFDNPMLRAWFKQNGDEYFGSWFWSNCFDVFVMATPHILSVRPTMTSCNLLNTAKALGIEVDESKLHDALYDIEITRAIFYKLFPLRLS
jgi:DNA polymerase-3 subunit epsilon